MVQRFVEEQRCHSAADAEVYDNDSGSREWDVYDDGAQESMRMAQTPPPAPWSSRSHVAYQEGYRHIFEGLKNLPAGPIVGGNMFTQHFKQDAYRYRPGVRRKQQNGVRMRRKLQSWYGQPSTNRLMESTFGFDLGAGREESKQEKIEMKKKKMQETARENSYRMYCQEPSLGPPAHLQSYRSSQPSELGVQEDMPLEWRLRPWEAEAHGIVSGSIPSLRSLRQTSSTLHPPPLELAKFPDTAPVLYPPGDPRGSWKIQRTIADERKRIIAEAIAKLPEPPPVHLSSTHSSPMLQARSPKTSPSLSPTLSPKLGPANSKSRRVIKLQHKKKKKNLFSEYDFFKIQSEAAGIPPRQFYEPDLAEPELNAANGGFTAFDLFKLEFRAMWNEERPELADNVHEVRDKEKRHMPKASPYLLAERRAAILKAATKAWDELAPEEKTPFETRAKVMSEPRAPTVGEQLAAAPFSWGEMNESRQWFFHGAEPQIEKLKTKLADLDNDLMKMNHVARNIGSIVIDDYMPDDPNGMGRSRKKLTLPVEEELTPEQLRELEEANDAKELNDALRKMPPRDPLRKKGETFKVWNGDNSETIQMKERKKSRKGRRSSLDLKDSTWQYKAQTSLAQVGIKVRRASADTYMVKGQRTLSLGELVTQADPAQQSPPAALSPIKSEEGSLRVEDSP